MDQLKEPLANSVSLTEKINVFATLLWQILKKRSPVPDRVTEFAVRRIVESKGNVPLRSLQQDLRLSERGLQRRFLQQVGISPKMFARVCRFQASLTQLRASDFLNLSDIAFDNGYSDQSHFIRTFREFAGFSPLQFQKNKSMLTPNFTVS
jgi:AraC-like DNA-binding protein